MKKYKNTDLILKLFATQLNVEMNNKALGLSLKDDFNVDSIDMLNIIYLTEKLFNVPIFDEDMNTVNTISDYVRLVESKIEEFNTY